MPVNLPANFDGVKFSAKYGLDPLTDFYVSRGVLFCPSLPNLTEADLLDCVVDTVKVARVGDRLAAAKTTAKAIPSWATWTQAQFDAWCDLNLMTDAAIDATTLSAALKTNIKANNRFTRNSGKMLIAMRDQTWPDLPEPNGLPP